MDEQQTFSQAYTERARAHRAAVAAKAAPKTKAKAKSKAKAKAGAGPPPRQPLPSTIPQSEARRFVPPGCYIWRGLDRSEWCGHCAPRKRVSASWHQYTEEGALRLVVRMLWSQYLEKEGLGRDACPYTDLFDD